MEIDYPTVKEAELPAMARKGYGYAIPVGDRFIPAKGPDMVARIIRECCLRAPIQVHVVTLCDPKKTDR